MKTDFSIICTIRINEERNLSFVHHLILFVIMFFWMCVEMNVLPDILAMDSDLDSDYDESQEEFGNTLYFSSLFML